MTNRTAIPLKLADLDSAAGLPCMGGIRSYAHWSAFVAHCRSLARDGLQYRVTLQPYADRPHILIEASGIMGRRKPPARSNGLSALVTVDQATKRLAEAQESVADRKRDLARKWGWWRVREWQPDGDWMLANVECRRKERRFGHWLAGRLALRPRGYRRPEYFKPNLSDYKSADREFGCKVPRSSRMGQHDQQQGWVKAVAGSLGVYWRWKAPEASDPEPVSLHSDDETPQLARVDWVERFLAQQKRREWSDLDEYRRAKIEVEYWREILRLLGEKHRGKI